MRSATRQSRHPRLVAAALVLATFAPTANPIAAAADTFGTQCGGFRADSPASAATAWPAEPWATVRLQQEMAYQRLADSDPVRATAVRAQIEAMERATRGTATVLEARVSIDSAAGAAEDCRGFTVMLANDAHAVRQE